MARPTGLPKTGGRKLGTPNKRSLRLNEIFNSLEFYIPSELVKLLPDLEVKDRAQVLLKLLEYVYPKRRPIELSVSETLETM